MGSPATGQSSQRTLPGASSEALRNINKAWRINDVAKVIPHDLHPQNKHQSSLWSEQFQAELEAISHVVHHGELEEFKLKCQATVDIRCDVKPKNGKRKPKRVTYLTLDDLISINRVFRHKRSAEMERENEQMKMEETARLQAQEQEKVKEEPDARNSGHLAWITKS